MLRFLRMTLAFNNKLKTQKRMNVFQSSSTNSEAILVFRDENFTFTLSRDICKFISPFMIIEQERLSFNPKICFDDKR